MNQSDGAELFGANDPRSSNIGIIHVAPTDDRQSVLAGILTQDKLGRKQVAVVLPAENRVFQRSVEFEGLKSMRRGLKSQIVFIMPSGSGPAEYARQRRFPVYSSLDSFARSVQTEDQARQVPQNPKRGWSFGRKPSSTGPDVVPIIPTPESIEREPTVPLAGRSPSIPEPEQVPPQIANSASNRADQQHEDLLPGAVGPGIGAIAADKSDAILPEDEDYDALLPAPVPQVADNSQFNGMADRVEPDTAPLAPKNVASNSEPSIIAFPTPRPKIRGQSASSSAAPFPPKNIPAQQQGNTAILGPAVSNRMVGGGAPPAKGVPGGTGGGGPRRNTGRRLLFALLVLLLATALCIGGIALAAPGVITPLTGLVPNTSTPSATVNITPKSAGTVQNPLQNQYDIPAVMGKPDPSLHQVQARQISNPASDQKTVPATGVGHISATRATGTLTFVNTSPNPITIASTTLTGNDGVQVSFNGSVTVPANPPTATVNAYAVNVGAKGNIAAYDIDGTCCVANNQIFVKNTSAFTGGKDAQTYSIVQQSDINGVVNLLAPVQQQNAKAGLKKLVHANENTVGPIQCPTNPDVTSDHKAGDIANTVTVQVAYTCTQDVYDQQAAEALATNLFKTETSKKLDSHYILKGAVLTSAKASILAGIITVSVTTKGVWVYQFTDLSAIAAQLAGKTKSFGENYLQNLDGVSSFQIVFNGGDGKTFPAAKDIVINVVDVQGLQGPPVSTTPGPIATPTPQPGLGGS